MARGVWQTPQGKPVMGLNVTEAVGAALGEEWRRGAVDRLGGPEEKDHPAAGLAGQGREAAAQKPGSPSVVLWGDRRACGLTRV